MDVGCGSGYLTVAMGRMVEPKGRVVGIDIVKPLVALARKNIAKADGDLLEKGGCVGGWMKSGWMKGWWMDVYEWWIQW